MSGEPRPEPDYLGLPIGRFLDELSAATPAPGGGAVAALAVAFAAGLCAMVAGLSAGHLPEAQALVDRARRLRDLAAPLAQADAEGYRAVLAASRARDGQARQAALSAACAVPMRVVEAGAEVAGIGAALAAEGKASTRGDAITAALLAAAGARAAAALVSINLAGDTGDGRPATAGRLAAEASRLAAEALRAPP